MIRIQAGVLSLVVVLSAGCAATGPSLRNVDMQEATAFERSLAVPPKPPGPTPELYVQPVNKAEPCKLPSTKSQTERANFKAYWDGGCKNGYAFGLGRDIAISDTHHYEEIATHDGTGKPSDAPSVFYDFVNNKVAYNVPTGPFPAASWYTEEITNSSTGFFVSQSMGARDSEGNNLVASSSPLRAERMFINDRRAVLYRFMDYSAMPVVNPSQMSFTAETQDPRTGVTGGVGIIRYATGQVQHVKLNGGTTEAVALPSEYVNAMVGRLKAVHDAMPLVQANIERARQMEREYLHLACSGKHTIEGLSAEAVTKICGWRAQFKEPFEKAQAKYASELEQARRQAEVAAQQRVAQQQLDTQQRQFQQQQMQQFSNAMAQIGQQARETSQQMLNSVASQPAPYVNFAPYTSGGGQVRCVSVGIVTNCRY